MPCRTGALGIVRVSDKVQRANATWNSDFGQSKAMFLLKGADGQEKLVNL